MHFQDIMENSQREKNPSLSCLTGFDYYAYPVLLFGPNHLSARGSSLLKKSVETVHSQLHLVEP